MMVNKEENLRERTISSLFSSYFATFSSKGIYLISHIILARILFPEDFGLFALAFMVLNIAKIIMQLGLGQYIVREEKVNYGALLVIEFATGLFVLLLLQVLTPHLAKYNSALPAINRILSFALIPYCLLMVPTAYALKELKLKRMLIPNLLYILTFAVTAILLSLKGLKIWALVYAQIASELMLLCAAWLSLGRSIPLNFNFTVKDIFRMVFGAKYFYFLALFGMVAMNVDKMILGKLVSLREVGYYTVAMTLAMYVTNIIEPALNNVFYPLFSKIKKDIAKTKEFYASATIILYWLEIPLYLFLVLNADIIIKVTLGSRWLPAIEIFRLLAILPILNPCATFGIHIMQAHSKEDIQAYFNIIHFILFVPIGYYLVMKTGLIGIIYATFLLQFLFYAFLYFINKITKNVLLILLKLLPIYLITFSGLTVIYFLFKTRAIAFFVSLIYLVVCYLYFYLRNIRKIIKEKFADVEIFRRLRLV